jgi:hypothetical protein
MSIYKSLKNGDSKRRRQDAIYADMSVGSSSHSIEDGASDVGGNRGLLGRTVGRLSVDNAGHGEEALLQKNW